MQSMACDLAVLLTSKYMGVFDELVHPVWLYPLSALKLCYTENATIVFVVGYYYCLSKMCQPRPDSWSYGI